MYDSHKRSTEKILLTLAAVILPGLAGCASPSATLELIAMGQAGLASARSAQKQHQNDINKYHQAQLEALDAAFDNDVRLAEAGQIKSLDGETIKLSADWVISARKGYAAARNILTGQMLANQAVNAIEMDNIDAAAEALDLAAKITVLQWNLGERIKQQFLKITRSFPNGRTKPNKSNAK
jgi:hypothetical protein